MTSKEIYKLIAEVYLFILIIWMTYRIIRAVKSGEIYYKPKFSFNGNWYYRESNAYMFWQTVVMWTLGTVGLLGMLFLLVKGYFDN